MPIVNRASTSTETTPTSRGIVRRTLLERVLRESGLGVYGTATGGSTTTIIDTTKLKSTQYSDDEFVDGWARISYDAGGAAAAPETEYSVITTYAPSTGTITFNPAMTAAPASGDKYELWRFPHPQVVLDIIDQCLTKDIYLPYWSILSEIPDFDMEQTHTTDWASSNATVTKSTTTPVLSGSRHLRVAATSDGGYAQSAVMDIQGGKQYYCSVLARGLTGGIATLNVYDVTNSASLGSVVATAADNNIRRLWVQVTAPTTCRQIHIRLTVSTSATSCEFDDLVFFCLDDKEISLPWWVEDRDQVKGIYKLKAIDLAANIQAPELLGDPDSRWRVVESGFGNGKLKLITNMGTLDSPIFIFGIRNEVAYTNDNTDTKMIDEDYLVSCVLYKLFSTLKNEPREGYLDSKFFQEKYQEWKTIWEQESFKVMQRINSVLSPATNYVYTQHPNQDLGWS